MFFIPICSLLNCFIFRIRELQNSYLSSHQIAHLKADERMQSIRDQFQCDLGMVSNLSTRSDSEDDSPFSNPALARKFRYMRNSILHL